MFQPTRSVGTEFPSRITHPQKKKEKKEMLALDISSLTFVALAIIGGVSAQTAGGYQQVGLPNSPLARLIDR